MTLDVDAPAPLALDPAQDAAEYDDADPGGSEYRREELETFLEDGAWEQASFEKWADDTDLSETAFDVVVDLDLIAEFDFFWDAFATRVGYHAPGLPENWREREIHPDPTPGTRSQRASTPPWRNSAASWARSSRTSTWTGRASTTAPTTSCSSSGPGFGPAR